MTIDAFPWNDVMRPSQVEFFVLDTTGSMRPYGGSSYEAIFPGYLFGQVVSWPLVDGIQRALLLAFIARQRGAAGRFRMPVYDHSRQGGLTATPTVNGAGQLGNTLTVSGLAGTDPVLRAGDFIAYSGGVDAQRHLGIVAQNVTAASGQIPICHELIESPPTGSSVATSGLPQSTSFPVAPIWQLLDNDAARRATRAPLISAVSMVMVTAPGGSGI